MSNTINVPMTALIPSGSAMPTASQTAAALRGTDLCGAGTATAAARIVPAYVREHIITGDAVPMPFPGTTAWSPPPR